MIATSHVWLFKLKLIKIKCNSKFSSLVALATFQGLNSHMWPGATILDNTDVEHFHHCRKSNWTALLSRAEGVGNITPKVWYVTFPDTPRVAKGRQKSTWDQMHKHRYHSVQMKSSVLQCIFPLPHSQAHHYRCILVSHDHGRHFWETWSSDSVQREGLQPAPTHPTSLPLFIC